MTSTRVAPRSRARWRRQRTMWRDWFSISVKYDDAVVAVGPEDREHVREARDADALVGLEAVARPTTPRGRRRRAPRTGNGGMLPFSKTLKPVARISTSNGVLGRRRRCATPVGGDRARSAPSRGATFGAVERRAGSRSRSPGRLQPSAVARRELVAHDRVVDLLARRCCSADAARRRLGDRDDAA